MRQQDACTNIILVSQQFPSPDNPCPRMADHPFKWVWILEDWSENRCGNDIFWYEIGSGFGELGGTPPPRIPRSPLGFQGQVTCHYFTLTGAYNCAGYTEIKHVCP